LNRVRAEVVLAYARTHARYAQIESNERAVQASSKAFAQDYQRIKNREGLPIEVLDSMRLLTRSRYLYLDAIVDYNRAHFDLYVALGQPPANVLARPVPGSLAPAPASLVAPQK
jgi:outer membrane protein TolC